MPNSKESSVRVLGVLFDQHLSLVSHVASLKSKLNKGIFGLNSMKDILDKERLLLIYNAHFHSHLNYCSNIFGLLSSTLTEQLFLLQKKAIRIVCNKGFLAHTKELFRQEFILPFSKQVELNSLIFMCDYVNVRLPETFDYTWITNWQDDFFNEREGPELRNAHDFKNLRTRYVFLDSHPMYSFYKLWNNLSHELKSIDCRTTFINKTKNMLLNRDD